MTLLPLPPNCVALEELPTSECPQGVLMELLGSLQHPYIYPILDLGFHNTETTHHYACLVMPFNPRGSLKDLIYKVSIFISYSFVFFFFAFCCEAKGHANTISFFIITPDSLNGMNRIIENIRKSHLAYPYHKYKD